MKMVNATRIAMVLALILQMAAHVTSQTIKATGYSVKSEDQYGEMMLHLTKNHFAQMYTVELKSNETWTENSEIRLAIEYIQNYGKLSQRIVFYCSPEAGKCTDVRVTNDEVYALCTINQPDIQSYLASMKKDDMCLDSSQETLSQFNLTMGRNSVNLEKRTVVLDFTFSEEPNSLVNDQVIMKWGIFSSSTDTDISNVRGSIMPLTFFNTQSFNDVYEDRGLLYTLNTLGWLSSAFWIFGMPIQAVVYLIFWGYLIILLLQCMNLMQSNDFTKINEEQAMLFSEQYFIEGPVMRFTMTNIAITIIAWISSSIPIIGFAINTYLWNILNVLNYTVY